ncbi:hypothetical protein JOB18_018868 [Solea senegalensis]|uniref:Uncharacterized protein n=2 Tax=Solea senegalensis TaxID=28829 RepID=A0AAV6QAE6_SOLSE|nr:uncharacterized protein si:dkey-246e1.3 isoform X2 [Solea senegalensis]KAG7485809.1 hypothetical protein JOB18_018868 [Solea senegalensis]
MTADNLHLNTTAALGLHDMDEDMDAAVFGVKVFNIVIIAVALCILTITTVYCFTGCYNRTRQSKRALMYESAVSREEPLDPVAVKAVKRSTSFINPLNFFRRPEAAKDNSRIYYIYSNPLPVGVKDEEEDKEEDIKAPQRPQHKPALPLSIQDYASDANSGVILDPPIFYMQL